MEDKHVVVINGVKMEVDLRYAKKIDTFKIGDMVKVLTKDYSNNTEVHHGAIVGFENFKDLPTIVVCYITNRYDGNIKFGYFNKDSAGKLDIVPSHDTYMNADKENIINVMDRQVTELEQKIADIKAKKEFFIKSFGKYFEVCEEATK